MEQGQRLYNNSSTKALVIVNLHFMVVSNSICYKGRLIGFAIPPFTSVVWGLINL